MSYNDLINFVLFVTCQHHQLIISSDIDMNALRLLNLAISLTIFYKCKHSPTKGRYRPVVKAGGGEVPCQTFRPPPPVKIFQVTFFSRCFFIITTITHCPSGGGKSPMSLPSPASMCFHCRKKNLIILRFFHYFVKIKI